jgi:hypothetical protein
MVPQHVPTMFCVRSNDRATDFRQHIGDTTLDSRDPRPRCDHVIEVKRRSLSVQWRRLESPPR